MPVPGPAALGHRDLLFVEEVLDGIAVGVFLQRRFVDVARIAIEDNLASQTTCIGADIYQMVSSTHDLLVVLNDHHRIA